MNTYRTTARVIGILFIAGMVIGIYGNILILSIIGTPDYLSTLSANSMKLAIGALLWLLTVAGDAIHGVLMYPILKLQNERIAVGYLASRIMDATFIAIMVLFILLQLPLGSEFLNASASATSSFTVLSNLLTKANLFSYDIAMTTLGVAGLLLCYSFYKSKLVPRGIAIWGLLGYATILCGSLLQIAGFTLNSMHTIPGGLWELFIGFWLLIKGFNQSAFSNQPIKADN
jgi:hypothetical protein